MASLFRHTSQNYSITVVLCVILGLIASSFVAIFTSKADSSARDVQALRSRVAATEEVQQQLEIDVSDLRQTLTRATAGIVDTASQHAFSHELLNASLWALTVSCTNAPQPIPIVHDHRGSTDASDGNDCESRRSVGTAEGNQPDNYHWEGDIKLVDGAGLGRGCRLEYIDRVKGFPVGKHDWDGETVPESTGIARLHATLEDHAAARRLNSLILIGRADRVPLGNELRERYGSNAGLAQARATWLSQELRNTVGESSATRRPILLSAGPLHVPPRTCNNADDDCDAKHRERDRSVEVFACLEPQAEDMEPKAPVKSKGA